MKASISNQQIVVNLTLKMEELMLIVSGMGKTSENGRIKMGMLEAEAKAVGNLYFALEEAIDNANKND